MRFRMVYEFDANSRADALNRLDMGPKPINTSYHFYRLTEVKKARPKVKCFLTKDGVRIGDGSGCYPSLAKGRRQLAAYRNYDIKMQAEFGSPAHNFNNHVYKVVRA